MSPPPSPIAGRLIAFYLPQFHPIPENDRAWGAGFTEWTNVTKAVPLYRGHHQPRLPADLGFYDLRLPEARAAQAELAAAHGIAGFCYWHYWFHGRRLLERPFDEVLASGRPGFPFCLGWANHSWSRKWTGEERDILVQQTYSPADDDAHGQWLARAFADPRYLRVGGRPLLLVFAPTSLPDPRRTCDAFRRAAVGQGLPEPFIVGGTAMLGHSPGFDARQLGFDATLNHLPTFGAVPLATVDRWHWRKAVHNLGHGRLSGKLHLYDYDEARAHMAAGASRCDALPSVFVGWDSTARRGRNGIIVTGATPDRFERALREAVAAVGHRPPAERLVFVNAWNEWAEGMHLEPDRAHGLAYLRAAARVAAGPSNGGPA